MNRSAPHGPPPPFKPKLPAKMAAAVDRLVEIHRGLMRQHNAGKGRVDVMLLRNLDLVRNELVLLADTVAGQPADFEVGRALQAMAEAATELARAYQGALAGKQTAAHGIRGRQEGKAA